MNKEQLSNLVECGLSQRKIADVLNTSQANIRYWLRKFQLNTKNLSGRRTNKIHNEKLCKSCNIIKSINFFYSRKNRNNQYYSVCKSCSKIKVLENQRKFKNLCIEYKGGKCRNCAYFKCNAALEFHHIESLEKEFEISKFRLGIFDFRVKNELDKCALLCVNCHREEHHRLKLMGL